MFGKSGYLRILKKQQQNQKDKESDLRFDGFPVTDYDKLSQALKAFYNVILRKKTMSSAGVSFGITDLEKKQLVFKECILEDADEEGQEFEPRDGNEMLSLNLGEVAQCVIQGNTKNEIEVQFVESDTVEAGADQLTSIRFYIPPDPDTDPTEPGKTSAEAFQEKIMKIANIRNTAGNAIVEFDESVGTFLTPRGRYNITLYDSFLRMYGSRYDYKIKYDDISRLFLLPKPNEVHKAFVIALDKPIRQGQQRYQMLVLQTNMEQQEITVNLDEETLKKEYNGDLQPIMQGQLCNLIAKSFKIIANKKVFVPGKFRNADNQECVKCALRANEGHLYPLEKSFVFIHKPPVLIRFDEVDSIEFQRYAGGQGTTRNFDLCVRLKMTTGDTSAKEYTFSGIDRSDFDGLYSFLSNKKIKILNSAQGLMDEGGVFENNRANRYVLGDEAGMDDEDSSEDEDFGSGDGESSSDEDMSDADEDDESADDSDLEEARRNAAKKNKEKSKEKSKPKFSLASSGKTKKPKEKEKQKQSKMKLKRSNDDISESGSKKNPKKKAKKDPNAPKRAMTAFMYFSNENRPKLKQSNPDLTFGDLAKLVGKKYKELSEGEKAVYEEKAKKDKERYKNEMANYTPPSDDGSDNDDNGSKKGKKKAKKDPNAPKRALTAFMYFSNEIRPKLKESNPDLAFGDIAKLVGKKYKELSEGEKAVFEEKANKDKERYKNEMARYKSKGSKNDSDSDSGSDSDSD